MDTIIQMALTTALKHQRFTTNQDKKRLKNMLK